MRIAPPLLYLGAPVLGGLELARMDFPRGLRVAGELDLSNVSALADALEKEIAAGEGVTSISVM